MDKKTIEQFGEQPEGATALTDEDYFGLKPKWIANRGDLDQAEAQNISEAFAKYFTSRIQCGEILDELFVRKLHSEMYSKVWVWAGKYRQVETSMGVDPQKIQEAVYELMKNSKYWIDSTSTEGIDKTVCEIHHKLVLIHPFRNGNGRMARLYADLLLISKGQPIFSWGGVELDGSSPTRDIYIKSLRAADKGDLSLLCAFVRS